MYMTGVAGFLYDPVNDYRLILDTPAAVKKRIAAVKTEFDAAYKGMVIAGGNPFIYLAVFSMPEGGERLLSDQLTMIATGAMPFKMHLKGFMGLEEKELYIDAVPKEPVLELNRQIKQITGIQHLKTNDLPRISIAQRLQVWQYAKSSETWLHRPFAATFVVNQMLLLKRMEGFRSWQVVRHLEFLNQLIPSAYR